MFKIDVILEGFIMSIGGITSILIRSCLSKLVPPDEIGKSNYQISSLKTNFYNQNFKTKLILKLSTGFESKNLRSA